MNSKQNMRRRALCMAMGACLASMAAAPVFAQSVTGAVAGRADAGAQVTISNPATGLTRSATVSDDGSSRIGQLPPGPDTLTSGSGAPIAAGVSLGRPPQLHLNENRKSIRRGKRG